MRSTLFSTLLFLCLLAHTRAEITVYGLLGQTTANPVLNDGAQATPTTTSFATATTPVAYTQLAAYNPIYLYPPAIPSPAPANTFAIGVPTDAALMSALSIKQSGTFFGFSIEMSVANQLSDSHINPPFLNFMSIIAQKAGKVHVRVGGNTQDFAYVVDSLADGKVIEKDKEDASNPTSTPVLALTPDLLYMLANVSSLVNVDWFLGIPFNDTVNWRFEIAEYGEAILGDHLLGFQVSNEPDLYAAHGHRASTYGPFDFFGEFADFTTAYAADSKVSNKNNLIAPNLASGNWWPEDIWNTGFMEAYGSSLQYLAMEHYPTDNCAVIFPSANNPPKDPTAMLPAYLTHQAGLNFVQPYLNSTALAQQWGKPFLLFETNTASCGGFPGISDTFTSALWGIDHALQLAHSNFSGALFHFGGQNVSYNPFTAVPTNESAVHQWTVGPLFYSAVFVAELMGTSGTTQLKDMLPNNADIHTPAYAVFENGQFSKMALLNYMTDPSGANDYTATIYVGGSGWSEANGVPASVKVKYLRAPSTSEKHNVTWAGRTLGGQFSSDGRWQGEETVQTVQCDQTQNMCQVKVPAPGAALVFFSDAAQAAAGDDASGVQTFATTAVTKTKNTVTVDPSVLATSNGESGKQRAQSNLGGTSLKVSAAASGPLVSGFAALAAVVAGAGVAFRASW
ncbi:glycoside hydrolase family 79 protein [Epithele typhae]|uniref:glycoside hydrolase family 79 protein n=1 Tax=Epithele typhae TaxID=378194 RepID=UPI0020079176|nr:glycoside hydrolase family 79 protein [Epithele typhae]KAH9914072.1 glycoside hydrolase family 79 protein [Epithele typhae]